jgi:putative flavoprotein involved in K+ transport
MKTRHEVIVIGAGWAGIGVSCSLKKAGIDNIILERGQICETWRTQRWDSFRMNTPNVLTVLPGDRYDGPEPEGYMTRDDFVAMVESYVRRNDLSVLNHTDVECVCPTADGFEVRSSSGKMHTSFVVIATGNLNVSKRPNIANRLPIAVKQIDGTEYRSASELPPGAILVVGCGNTGGQIAEELAQQGRKVYLSTGRNGRVPRNYRGRDIFLWLTDTGRMAKPRAVASGRGLIGATHTISLQSLSAQGVVVLGKLRECTPDGRLSFDDTLAECADYGDEMSAMLRREIDDYIEAGSLNVPAPEPDPAEEVVAHFPDPPIRELVLTKEGINTVIWAVGLRGDYGWLQVPGALDTNGNPIQDECVSVPGIYFAGLDSLASLRAGTVLAAGVEATKITKDIASHRA